MDYLKALSYNLIILLFTMPLIILGFIVVPFGLLFKDDSKKDLTYKTDGTNEWWLRTLPSWAKWWNNPIDGFLGDDSYRWASRDIPFGWKNTSFLGMFWWGAIRNPLNYFKRFVISCDVRECSYELLQGQEYVRDDITNQGYQFLKATRRYDGKAYYRIYGVWQYGQSSRAFVLEIGNKFDKSHFSEDYTGREYKAFKGFTFVINPYKEI